jgi:LemA protein
MRKRLMLLILCGLAALPPLSGCGYNQMQQNEEAVFAAWADVAALDQRRADLIPNLVETVKGYAGHERETLQAVTEARAKVGQMNVSAKDLDNPAALEKFQAAQGELSGALSRAAGGGRALSDLKPTRTSSTCSTNWKGRRTASTSPASATTRRCRPSTARSAPFPTT